MSNEHLSAHHPWAGHNWAHQVLASLDRTVHNPIVQSWLARLSGVMIYIAAAMLAFIVAVDGYVLLRTM